MKPTAKYANLHRHTDIEPYEVVGILTEKCILVRAMDFTEDVEVQRARQESFVPGGFLGHFDNDLQKWIITPNESNEQIKIRLHKDGVWKSVSGNRFRLSDEPKHFYDYNF